MAWTLYTGTNVIANGGTSVRWWGSLNQQYWVTTTSSTTNYVPVFTSNATTGAVTWQNWCNNIEIKATWFSDPAWVWQAGGYNQTAIAPQPARTAEEIEAEVRTRLEQQARAEQERAEARARMEVREREIRDANQLAESLLLACLSPEQARQHLELGYIDVTGSRGHRFRIQTAVKWDGRSWRGGTQSGNVLLLDAEGKTQAKYCVHPPDALPHADAWLAQKLALEADEDTVLAVANLPWRAAGHRDIREEARSRLRLVRDAA